MLAKASRVFMVAALLVGALGDPVAFWLAGATLKPGMLGWRPLLGLGPNPKPEIYRKRSEATPHTSMSLGAFIGLKSFLNFFWRLGFGGVQALGVQASITQQCVGFEAADEESW